MAKQFAISAGNHGACIPKQGHDCVTRVRFLPAMPILPACAQEMASNILLTGSVVPAVGRAQHANGPCPLLMGHPGVRWNRPIVQERQKAVNCSQAAEAINRKWDDRHQVAAGLTTGLQDGDGILGAKWKLAIEAKGIHAWGDAQDLQRSFLGSQNIGHLVEDDATSIELGRPIDRNVRWMLSLIHI